MPTLSVIVRWLVMIAVCCGGTNAAAELRHRQFRSKRRTNGPQPVIFDTDYGPFIDDGM
jgi:hypothetical protein